MRWLALLVVAGAAHGIVAAAPQVDIKAQTQLSLGAVRLLGDGNVEVRGQLTDKLTSEPLANQLVVVKLGSQLRQTTTDGDGRFRATMVGTPGAQPIQLEFAGTAALDRAEPVSQITDPSRAQVGLAIRSELTPDGATIQVAAEVHDEAVVLPVVLSLGSPGDSELRELTKIETGAPFRLARAAAGGAGTRRLRATFAGDDGRQAASAEITLELTSTTTTTMKVSATQLAFEDDVVAAGRVVDQDGKPVARAAVALTAGDRRLAQSATGADGGYRFEVEAEILGTGPFGIYVQSEPGTAALRPSKSAPVIVQIAAPQPVPVSYTIAAFLATALAAGGFFTARAKPWRRLRRARPPADLPENEREAEDIEGGLVVAKPGLVSTLRRASDDGFSGVVKDTVRARPIVGAVIRLVLADESHELRAGADGSFAIEQLTAGEWRAEVTAPGHVREQFAVTIPHRGELRGVRIDLVPVRERVFQLYRRAAEPVLPEPRLWGIWSPRQIVDHVRSKRPSPALADLTDFVEEVYFSARVAAESALADAADRVDRAIHERTRVAS